MARPLAASQSFVGSFTEVFRGKGWSRPGRRIEITLGEARYWRDGKWVAGEQHVFVFDEIEDARLVAQQILAEVKLVKAAAA